MKSMQGITTFREVGGGFGYRSDPQPPNLGGLYTRKKGGFIHRSDPQPPNLGGTSTRKKGLER